MESDQESIHHVLSHYTASQQKKQVEWDLACLKYILASLGVTCANWTLFEEIRKKWCNVKNASVVYIHIF